MRFYVKFSTLFERKRKENNQPFNIELKTLSSQREHYIKFLNKTWLKLNILDIFNLTIQPIMNCVLMIISRDKRLNRFSSSINFL